jgi:hypothetical protein
MSGGDTFLDRRAMVLGEIQSGNSIEAMVPSARSKRRVRWGPSLYYRASTHIVVDSV